MHPHNTLPRPGQTTKAGKVLCALLLATAVVALPAAAFAESAQEQEQQPAQQQRQPAQGQSAESQQQGQQETVPALVIPNFSPLTPEAQARERGITPEAEASADPAGTLLSPAWGGSGSGARKPAETPAGQTVADQRLQRIYDAQLEFFAQLEANPNMAESARDQRAQNLISQYQSLLLDNPEYVYGYIMYAKLLRQVGQRDLANKAFVKANSLDPDIAVVKQQIANYLSEEGDYDLALPYFLAAIRLAPETAVYHYQLGQLLHTYRSMFLTDGKLTADVLDKQLQEAFANAARLDPQTRIYALRSAESFFDVATPDWNEALALWEALEQSAVSEQERQVILLQKSRVLLDLDQGEAAAELLKQVTEPALQAVRKAIEEAIANPESAPVTPADAPQAKPQNDAQG